MNYDIINFELQDLAEIEQNEAAEQLMQDMKLDLEEANFVLQQIAEESRMYDIDLRWEDMMNDLYWNLYSSEEYEEYDLV